MKSWFLILSLILSSLSFANAVPTFYGAMKYVKVDKANISYYRFGQGKPLVLIPGRGVAMTMWHPLLLQQLSQNHDVIIFDYPGIGESTIDGAFPNSMAQLGTLVNSFIQTQKVTKPDMLGASMGGSLLLYMVGQNGALYDHVIVVGGKAGGKKTILPKDKYFKMLSDLNVTPEVAVKTLLFPPTATKQAEAYLQVMSTMPAVKREGKALFAQAQAVSAENGGDGVWGQLPGIKNKVLIVNGTDDILTPTENAVLIATAIPASWLVQVKGAGHGVLLQEPEYMSQLILLFLQY